MRHLPRSVLLLAVVMSIFACDEGASSLEFSDISPDHPRLGETAVVRFRVLDGNRNPIVGQGVEFALQGSPPGVTLGAKGATSNKDGYVTTTLLIQSRVSSVVVSAKTGTEASTITVNSPPLAFAGGGPNARQFTFQCGPIAGDASGGIHGIIAYDAARYLIAGVKLECTAHVGDRNGDGIPGAQVSFITEAGAIAPTEVAAANVIGNATVLYKTSLPLPQDVAPGRFTFTPANDASHTGEFLAPLWMEPWYWSDDPVKNYVPGVYNATLEEPQRIDPLRPGYLLNPRDNLVAMIALTTGEEAFNDDNNDGIRQETETFTDLTEPFVDNNDNGTWDPGERFVDVNGDRQWTPKNGVYDANTTIWVQERILWTGWPQDDFDRRNPSPVVRVYSGPLSIPHFGFDVMRFALTDPWFNAIARNDGGDGCELSDRSSVVESGTNNFGSGIRFDYPSVDYFAVVVQDKHDPNGNPTPGAFASPVGFSAPILCTFTASPNDGFKLTYSPGAANGTVQ